MFKYLKERKKKKKLNKLPLMIRERTILFEKYFDFPRYTEQNIDFLQYSFIVPDCLSFIHQFKEIFEEEVYKFTPKNNNPIIIDCGSNIGTSCLYFAEKYPSSTIYAYEADKNIFDILCKNLKKNQIKNTEVFNKAVWINNEELIFASDGADGGSFFKETKNKIKVDAIKLKDFIDKFNQVDFLKLDVEGAEDKIIEDCKDVLYKMNNIFIEYHSFNDKQQNLDKILEILTQKGFRYYLDSLGQRKSPFIQKQNNNIMDLQVNIFAYKV